MSLNLFWSRQRSILHLLDLAFLGIVLNKVAQEGFGSKSSSFFLRKIGNLPVENLFFQEFRELIETCHNFVYTLITMCAPSIGRSQQSN